MMSYPARDNFQTYPQQYTMYHQTRAHQPQTDPAQSLNVNPYANFTRPSQPQPQPQEYPSQPQMQSQQRSTQQPGSPGSEDGFKPSLPSISNLLGIADGDRPGQDAGMCDRYHIVRIMIMLTMDSLSASIAPSAAATATTIDTTDRAKWYFRATTTIRASRTAYKPKTAHTSNTSLAKRLGGGRDTQPVNNLNRLVTFSAAILHGVRIEQR